MGCSQGSRAGWKPLPPTGSPGVLTMAMVAHSVSFLRLSPDDDGTVQGLQPPRKCMVILSAVTLQTKDLVSKCCHRIWGTQT